MNEKYRILVADDELIEKMFLCKLLKKNFGDQCEIFQAENGREALEIFEEKDIQIAIMDIEMPGINGIEASEEMKRRKPGCCIIFLTAFDEFSYAKKAITIHALDYLLKPYKEEELFSVIEEAMRIVQAESKNAKVPEVEEGLGQQKLMSVKESIEKYIHSNYAYDISMQDVAKTLSYSEAYFCKLFKNMFDMNFTTYLAGYRIEKAKNMLRAPRCNVKDIGEAVGYPDSNYFTKVFKRTTGLSPSEYRLVIFDKKEEE